MGGPGTGKKKLPASNGQLGFWAGPTPPPPCQGEGALGFEKLPGVPWGGGGDPSERAAAARAASQWSHAPGTTQRAAAGTKMKQEYPGAGRGVRGDERWAPTHIAVIGLVCLIWPAGPLPPPLLPASPSRQGTPL